MQIDDGDGAGDSRPDASGPPSQPPPKLPPGGALPPAPPEQEAAPPEGDPSESKTPGRRVLLGLAAVAAAVIFVAAGFGLAQLVDGDAVDATSSSTPAQEDPGGGDASSDPSDAATPEATPDASEEDLPSLADQLPFLDELPFDSDELERLFEEFQQRLGDDFAEPFGELPSPEDIPGLEDFPFFDELPLGEDGLEELLDRLREQFGDRLPPGLEEWGFDRDSSDNGDEA